MGCSQSVPVDTRAASAAPSKGPSSAAAAGKSSTPAGAKPTKNAPASTGSTSVSDSPQNYAGHVLNENKQAIGKPPMAPTSTTATTSGSSGSEKKDDNRSRFESYASGASTPDEQSHHDAMSGLENSDDDNGSIGSNFSHKSTSDRSTGNNKPSSSKHNRKGSLTSSRRLVHSTSAVGLDEMIEERREVGDLRQNVVHFEVPFGKPIEEVYDGVHNGPVLGSGISGLVRLVTHKATGLKYAVKVLDLGLVDTQEGLKQLREEIFIMCQLDHPNIVRLEEVYESHSEIYLVQELCLGGELFDRLDEQPDYHYTEAECARLVKQMLSAVRYLHSKGIIHRDLKLENFLFSSTSTDSELKMIDFGLSKHFRYGEIQHEAVGTPYTVAPEVIRGSYDERCDIWAIGVISFLLLSGEPPFGGCGGPEPLMTVRSNILKGNFAFEPEDIWASVSQLARDFIKCLLVTDPKHRPTAREAQKHKWMQEWASRSRKVQDNVLNPNVVKALVNFKEFSDMRKLLCEVLSFTLLPDQIKELRREFEKMDTDGSGEISLSALKQVLMTNAGAGSLGALTEEEVEDIFNAMRVRKTETRIHWHEFIAAGLSQCQVDDRNLRLAFDRLDSDHKGYITLDDIMDLMGSDALQSEDAMRAMWGDSIKAVKCQHARITYDDFLLLMKGQSRENPSVELDRELEASVSTLMPLTSGSNRMLHVLHEGAEHEGNDATPKGSNDNANPLNGISLKPKSQISVPGMANNATNNDGSSSGLNLRPTSPFVPNISQSAPSTPADHKLILDVDEAETPPIINQGVGDDIISSGPGIPGTSASLTPPHSPERSARDYVTPMGFDRYTISLPNNVTGIEIPGLPSTAIEKPSAYTRRRSRSVDDQEQEAKEKRDLQGLAEAVRDMIVPETGHFHLNALDAVVKDEKKSNLVVNRQLYRAHRHMRLAVLEASKRFEEQQARHARDVLLAIKEKEDTRSTGMIQAGLVMRHGSKAHVSSEAIRKLLRDNEAEQQVLVEKANKRGGRGRRSRKKTISDMSGLMNSMGQDDMGAIAVRAAERIPPPIAESKVHKDENEPRTGSLPNNLDAAGIAAAAAAAPPTVAGPVRDSTKPGDFHKTVDPFGRQGKYGATVVNYDEDVEC